MDDFENPMGTDGFEFVEFTAPDPVIVQSVFRSLGFRQIGQHRSKAVQLWRQGEINFLINSEAAEPVASFREAHGPSANAMAFRVKDAGAAYRRALDLGAAPYVTRPGAMELNIPAITGVGGSAIYLVDRYGPKSIYEIDFDLDSDTRNPGAGLTVIDHLTHNLRRGEMDRWYDFYHRVFNFREIRYFDIAGQHTGLKSRALTSPDGQIRIPLNEGSGGDKLDQIEEFIQQYNGEGIQHIALATNDAFTAIDKLRALGLPFQDAPPETYYEMLDERLPGHGEDVERLRTLGLLMDGSAGGKLLLQEFSQTCIGPIFFEIIQRKGDEGFGNGNFTALFESIERDQVRRGVIKAIA